MDFKIKGKLTDKQKEEIQKEINNVKAGEVFELEPVSETDNFEKEMIKRAMDYTRNTYREPERASGFIDGVKWTLKKLSKERTDKNNV